MSSWRRLVAPPPRRCRDYQQDRGEVLHSLLLGPASNRKHTRRALPWITLRREGMLVPEASTGRRDTLKGARLSQGDAPFDGSRYLEVRIADNARSLHIHPTPITRALQRGRRSGLRSTSSLRRPRPALYVLAERPVSLLTSHQCFANDPVGPFLIVAASSKFLATQSKPGNQQSA
jgi:hypothetical protein